MTEKGFEVFKRAIEVNCEIIDYIVVGEDSNVEKDFSKEIIDLARNAQVDFYLRGNEPTIVNNNYVFAISWRWIINHPTHKLVIFHDSLLPKYRGFGFGTKLLSNVESEIGNKKYVIWCNARYKALDFYKKNGFKRNGNFFIIKGVGKHLRMEKNEK